ncbi:MAG: GGDEF domain-containing protein [Betaproteobacteria bacterium]|jgi:diguanylate cyclase (GGDEF)-like protein
MRETLTRIIIRLGRGGTVAAVTAASVVLSVGITYPLTLALGAPPEAQQLIISALVPLLVASAVSWFVVEVLFRLHALESEIRRVATVDMLTGVMTRHAFFSAADTAHRIAARNLSPLSAISIDIDDFKRINDSHGHAGGDLVLNTFGKTLRQCARNSDIIGRIGGEEFVMVLPDTALEGAIHLGRKILAATAGTRVENEGRLIAFSVSIGAAEIIHADKTSLEQLLRQSDQALYTAKHMGKNTVSTLPAKLQQQSEPD